MKTRTLLTRTLRALLAGLAVLVILLGIALGGFRLVVAELPSYQAQLKAWVDSSLGLSLDFDKMDARFGLRGPELTFRDVSVTAQGASQPFLVSDRASVVIDLWAALADRRLRISRLAFDGTRLTVIREADRTLHLLGGPDSSEAHLDLALVVPPGVELGVTDSIVVYVDRGRNVAWTFHGVDASLTRGADLLQLRASAEPPPQLGRRFEVSAQAEFHSVADLGKNWRLFGDLRGVALGVLAKALPRLAALPAQGSGDLGIWLDWRDGILSRAMAQASLDGIEWSANSGADDGYRHAAFSAEWLRNASGWRLMLSDMNIERAGRTWPKGADAVVDVARGPAGLSRVKLHGDFVRLEDLDPLAHALGENALAKRWLELDPRGELSHVDFALERSGQGWGYSVSGGFEGLGVAAAGDWPGFDGLSGELRADSDSGRVSLDARSADLDYRRLFRRKLDLGRVSGTVIWRKGYDGIRIVSDDLEVDNADARTSSNLELTLPARGGSALLDMQTHIGPFAVVAAKRYLPVHAMPPGVVRWLDRSLQGGRAKGAEMSFVGPLKAFPFDAGQGRFSVEADVTGAVLEYVHGWPRAVDLNGKVNFVNAGFAARATGRVLGNRSRDVRVDIPDLRKAVLRVRADTSGHLADVLTFLQDAPLIAHRLGPGYDRLHSPAGGGTVALDLTLPLKDMSAYKLRAKLGLQHAELAVDGFDPHATQLDGTLDLSNGELSGRDIHGIFLDGPITASVGPPPDAAGGYRALLDFSGEVTADAVARAFHLPFARLAAGQTRWRGRLSIPAQPAAGAAPPLKIEVSSNLAGVALNLPAPFAKAPAEPVALGLDIELPDSDHLSVAGHFGATRRFTLSFADGTGRRRLVGGALRFGGAEPPPPGRGLVVDGTLPELHFDDWIALMGGSAPGSALADASVGSLFEHASLDIADCRVFGQRLGPTKLDVRAGSSAWLIDVDSQPIAGHISVPRDLAGRPQIVARMKRLYLEPGDGDGLGAKVDPRKLVGLSLDADELGFGRRRLGHVKADVQADPLGLKLVSFASRGKGLTVDGSGGWLDGPAGFSTRLSLELHSTDVAAALADLAVDPIAAGKQAVVKAQVEWPGAPTTEWMQHVAGRLSLHFENGSLLDIDPGAGRVVGLMSITALPRRLALDFRDVFNKGLVFDKIDGDFEIIDGNAYTNNLKVSSPAAEIGVAGRVGLRDRDYAQQAVVAAEPGKVLPTVGGLIGGPGVGAALLIFTRIFKQPLKGIGRASYCITGKWDAPKVERLAPEEVQKGRICADLPPGGLAKPAPNAAAAGHDEQAAVHTGPH